MVEACGPWLQLLTELYSVSQHTRIILNHEAEWALFGWLVGVLTSSSTTRLYRWRAPRQSVWQFYMLPHMRQSWETTTSISAGHIILTPTQPVGSGRPQRESNPGPPQQDSRALPTELPRPLQSEQGVWLIDWLKIFYKPSPPWAVISGGLKLFSVLWRTNGADPRGRQCTSQWFKMVSPTALSHIIGLIHPRISIG